MNKRIVSIISFMLTIMMTVNAIAAVPVSGENGQNTLYSAVIIWSGCRSCFSE